jgi:hypothetical protein
VIKIQASKQLTFLNTRQFFHDLQPAESRYKVVAKPVPYKPPQPAPSHYEGVTPTLPEPSPTPSLLSKHKASSIRNKNSPNSKYANQKNQGRSEQTLLPKVSLKDFLENKKKQKLLLEKEEEILEQVKQHSKATPKTKYETDTVIYPTTTYRPQTQSCCGINYSVGFVFSFWCCLTVLFYLL